VLLATEFLEGIALSAQMLVALPAHLQLLPALNASRDIGSLEEIALSVQMLVALPAHLQLIHALNASRDIGSLEGIALSAQTLIAYNASIPSAPAPNALLVTFSQVAIAGLPSSLLNDPQILIPLLNFSSFSLLKEENQS
jgi:hypothetical protein